MIQPCEASRVLWGRPKNTREEEAETQSVLDKHRAALGTGRAHPASLFSLHTGAQEGNCPILLLQEHGLPGQTPPTCAPQPCPWGLSAPVPCLSHRFGDHTPTGNQFTLILLSLFQLIAQKTISSSLSKKGREKERRKQLKARNPKSGPAGGLSLTLALEDVT